MAEEFKLATAGDDIKIWELKGFSIIDQFNPHNSGLSDICFSHSNQLIASASTCADKVVLSFVKNKASPLIQVAENSKPTCVSLNSNSRYLANAGKNQVVQVWDTKSCKLKKTYKGHQDTINCVRFNWNDSYLASGSANGEIYLHNVVSGVTVKPLVSPGTQSIQQLEYSYFKKALLAAVSDDGALNLWDTNASKSVASFADSHRAPATALSFSPVNDMLLASAGLDKRIVCYSVQAKSTIKTITADAPLTSMAFATDGATLAAGTTRGKVLVYDLRMGALPIRTVNAHKTSVQAVAFSKASNNKSESSEVKATTVPSRSKLIAGEPQVTSAVKNGLKPGKTLTKDQPQANGLAGRQVAPDIIANKDQTDDVLFSPVSDATVQPSKESLSNGLTTRPEVLGKASTSRADSFGGVFSPLGENTENTRGNPVGSVSMTPTFYQTKQPITGDVTLGFGGTTSGPSTPTGMSPRSTGLSPRHSRKSPGRSSTGSLDLEPSQFRTNTVNKAESPRQEESFLRPGITGASSGVENPMLEEPSSIHGVNNTAGRLENYRPEESSSRAGMTNISNRLENSRMEETPDITSNISWINKSKYPTLSIPEPSPVIVAHGSGPFGDKEGATQGAVLPSIQPTGGFNSFQIDFIKNMIDDSLEEFRDSIHRDIRNLQTEMLRQFTIQKIEMQALFEKYSVNKELVSEIEKLREENNRLKSKY